MIKNFHNFALESVNMQTDLFTNQMDIRQLFQILNNSKELVCVEMNKVLSGKEIKISEMAYDQKKNLFFIKNIINKFVIFNHVGKYSNDYYIKFDNDCMIRLDEKLLIEHRLIIHNLISNN